MTYTPTQIWAFVIAAIGLILTILSIADKVITLKKNADAPQKLLEERVKVLEVKAEEHERSLKQGNDKFKEHERVFAEQEHTNGVVLHSVMALIQFEIQYCLIEHKEMSKGLEQAKEDLDNFLAKKK